MSECTYYKSGKKCTSLQVFDNPIKNSGYCNRHYIQSYAYGRNSDVQSFIPTKRFTKKNEIFI